MDLDILEDLRALADASQAEPMRAYMRNLFPFLGVATPARRAVLKRHIRHYKGKDIDWSFVFHCWSLDQREFQYLAMDYLKMMQKSLTSDDIKRLRQLVVTKSWWDSVDFLSAIIGSVVINNPALKREMLAWSRDDNIWIRRVAILHQLLYKERTDQQLLQEIITNNLGSNEFFINKAIGWSLRQYARSNPSWVIALAESIEPPLSPLSLREALKHVK